MKRAKQKRSRKPGDGFPVPRVYRRKPRGKKSARLLIKCGDCDEKFEIHYGPEGEDLEIAGVLASVENWREILLPLLKKPRETNYGANTKELDPFVRTADRPRAEGGQNKSVQRRS